jgi:outer membrane autotransporter protein
LIKRHAPLFPHYLIHLLFALILTIVTINDATASQTFVQPIGTIIQQWNPTQVNQLLEKWDSNIIPGITDPFDTRYAVSEVQPTKTMYFVRVYADPSTIGTFLVRASNLRGLTPAQIRNVLALPAPVTKIEYVKVPAGAQYGLWTGIAAPIMSPGYEWGQGGAEQTKVIGKHTNQSPPADPARFANYSFLPTNSYMNAQLIGNYALSYSQSVNSGNAGKVAAYLDKHLPFPYSDMEDVYTTLDFINADGPPQLAIALNQISPINFDTYSTVWFRNDLLFNQILFEHAQLGFDNTSAQHLKVTTSQTLQPKTNKRCFASWANITGEQGEQTTGANRPGFYYQTGVLSGGADCQISSNFKIGIGAAYFIDHLGWNQNGGNATVNNAKLGLYSNYVTPDYFFNSALTGGFDWGSAQRNINFSGNGIAVLTGLVVDTLSVNRAATSNQTGQNMGLYFTGGKVIPFNEWSVMPTAQISYFYSGQDSFDESGAADLNLHVQNFTAQTIRTQLAMSLGRILNLQQGSLIKANVQLGWAHNFPLDNRVITAMLPALGGEFSVNGNNNETNEVLASANVSAKITKKCWSDIQYIADVSHGFNSQSLSLILKYYLD